MTKRFFAAGFFYNPRNKKVLLKESASAAWNTVEGVQKPGEKPLDTFKRAVYENLKLRLPNKAIQPLYSYHNEDMDMPRYVFVANTSHIKHKVEVKPKFQASWISLQDALKLDLTEKTKQDLTYFYREESFRKNVHKKRVNLLENAVSA